MEHAPRATDPQPHAHAPPHLPSKLRLLCSYNGHILPRPHDKTLCYIGGDTRLITLDNNHHHPPSLSKLIKKILKTTSFDVNTSFMIKYQLPSEDLDSLISVSTDEDLEHMIEEYNSCENSNTRIRLFLFPRNSDSVKGEFVESVKSIGSVLLEGSDKSNEVFVQGLNGRLLTSCLSFCSDNSLLELEDVDEVKEVEKKVVVVQDVQEVNKQESPGFGSVPDSPVKVKEEVNYVAVVTAKVSGNGLGQRVSSGFDMASPGFGSVPDSPVKVNGQVKEEVNYVAVREVKDPVVVTAKVSGNGLGQRVSSGFDMASPDSVSSDGSLTNPLSRRNPSVIYQDAATQTQYSNNNNNGITNDQNTRIRMQQQQIHDSVYSMSTSTAAVTTTTQSDLHKPNGVTNDQNTRIQMQQQQIHDSAYSMSTSTAAVTTTTQTDLHKPNGVTNDQNTRIQMQQQQIHDSAYSMSTSTAAVTTTTQTDLQHPQVHQQHQFIHTAVPPPQYIHHHPSGVVPMASYYPIYPPQSQHHVPVSALDQRKIVYYMPAISAPPNSQVPTPSSLFTTPRTVQPASKPESPVYRTNSSGASGPQLVQVPSSQHQHQPQPQYVAYSHIQQPSQAVASSGGSGGNYAYEFADLSQQGQHLYYAAQPMLPQSAAQYQTMSSTLPVEGGSHIQLENSMKQQVKTSQP